MIGELTFFLGLQVKQSKKGIFIHHEKYAKDLIKKFGLKTPMSSSSKLDKNEKGNKV